MIPQIRRVGQHAFLYATVRQQLMDSWAAQELGVQRWHLDSAQKMLSYTTPDRTVTARAQLIASIEVDPALLLWGHSSAHDETGPHLAAARVGAHGDRHNLPDLSNSAVPYRFPEGDQVAAIERLSHDVGAAAIEIVGPEHTYFSAATDATGKRVVVLLDEWSEAPPVPTIADLHARLPELLPATDDPQYSLEGLVGLLPGWTLERQEHDPINHRVWRVTDDRGARFDVHYSLVDGKLTEVQLHDVVPPAG